MIKHSMIEYLGNGSTTTYTFPFQYLNKANVRCRVNGVDTPFTWVSASSIRLAVAPAQDVPIVIYRETQRDSLLVVFQDGTGFRETTLNKLAQQLFYLTQEAYDKASDFEGNTLTLVELEAAREEFATYREDIAASEALINEARNDAVTASTNAVATVTSLRDTTLADLNTWRTATVATVTTIRDQTISAGTTSVEAAQSARTGAEAARDAALVAQTLATVAQNGAQAARNAASESELAAIDAAESAAASASHAYAAAAEAWDPLKTYLFPQAAADIDGHTYRCTSLTGVSGTRPGLDEPNWTRLTSVTEGFFDLDTDGDLTPNLITGYSDEWTVDENLDITPRQ